jgi:hypothetical protein
MPAPDFWLEGVNGRPRPSSSDALSKRRWATRNARECRPATLLSGRCREHSYRRFRPRPVVDYARYDAPKESFNSVRGWRIPFRPSPRATGCTCAAGGLLGLLHRSFGVILQPPRERHSEQRDRTLHARLLSEFVGDGQNFFVRCIEQVLAKCFQKPLESEFGSNPSSGRVVVIASETSARIVLSRAVCVFVSNRSQFSTWRR